MIGTDIALAACVISAATAFGTLAAYISLAKTQRTIRNLTKPTDNSGVDKLATRLDSLDRKLALLEQRIVATPQPQPVVYMNPAMPESVTTQRKTQAIKLAQRGESAEEIASLLEMPENHVKLLLKVRGAQHAASVE